MASWTIWATSITVGTVASVMAIYLLCRARIEQTRDQLLALERQLAVARMREEANERKLARIFEAVVALRETTDEQLGLLRKSLDELLTERFSAGDPTGV